MEIPIRYNTISRNKGRKLLLFNINCINYTIRDVFLNFAKIYEKVFFTIPRLDENCKNKLYELFENIPDFFEILPEVLSKLKNTEFDFVNQGKYKPDIAWLLKDSNFIRLANKTQTSSFNKDALLEEVLNG